MKCVKSPVWHSLRTDRNRDFSLPRISHDFHLPSSGRLYSCAPDRLKLNKTWFSCVIFLDCGLLHLTALSALFCSTFPLFPSNLRICTLGFIQSRKHHIQDRVTHRSFPFAEVQSSSSSSCFLFSVSLTVHLSLSLYNKHPHYPFHHFFLSPLWLVWGWMLVFKSTIKVWLYFCSHALQGSVSQPQSFFFFSCVTRLF